MRDDAPRTALPTVSDVRRVRVNRGSRCVEYAPLVTLLCHPEGAVHPPTRLERGSDEGSGCVRNAMHGRLTPRRYPSNARSVSVPLPRDDTVGGVFRAASMRRLTAMSMYAAALVSSRGSGSVGNVAFAMERRGIRLHARRSARNPIPRTTRCVPRATVASASLPRDDTGSMLAAMLRWACGSRMLPSCQASRCRGNRTCCPSRSVSGR